MLKQDLAIIVAREFGYSDSETISPTDAILINYLNWVDEIVLRIFNEMDWGFQDSGLFEQVTIAGDPLLLLDPNILHIRKIQQKDTLFEIKYAFLEWLIKQEYDFTKKGDIFYWAWEKDYEAGGGTSRRQIRLVYTPSSSVNLFIVADKVQKESLSDTEHIPLPSNFIPMLKHGVRGLAYRNEDQDQKAEFYELAYERELIKLKKKFSNAKYGVLIPLPNADLRTTEQLNIDTLRVPDTIEVG